MEKNRKFIVLITKYDYCVSSPWIVILQISFFFQYITFVITYQGRLPFDQQYLSTNINNALYYDRRILRETPVTILFFNLDTTNIFTNNDFKKSFPKIWNYMNLLPEYTFLPTKQFSYEITHVEILLYSVGTLAALTFLFVLAFYAYIEIKKRINSLWK